MSRSDDMPKRLDMCHTKLAFVKVAEEVVFPYASEHIVKVLRMLLFGLCKDDYVIKVCKADFVDEAVQNRMHCALEHGGGVGQTEWHDRPLVQTVGLSK